MRTAWNRARVLGISGFEMMGGRELVSFREPE
jgi:hypothetical protein